MPIHLEIAEKDLLEGARFRLVEATVRWDDKTSNVGWGRDADIDRATWKAIGEAVERRCFGRLPSTAVLAKAVTLSGVLPPEQLVRYLPFQLGAGVSGMHRFDTSEQRYWLPAQSVLGTDAAHVLADLVCSPRAFDPAYREQLVLHASTSGCASGDTLGDAILRATLELVERDAFLRHWLSQRAGHAIDTTTLSDRHRARLAHLSAAGCAIGLQWLHLGCHPTWLAWAQHPHLHFTCVGAASGLVALEALDSALSELETQVLARLQGVPAVTIPPESALTPADHGALYATAGYFRQADRLWQTGDTRTFDQAQAAFAMSADSLYENLARAGHQPFWVDLSTEEARGCIDGKTIHTVRAVAPGLIPMVFGHGRLPLGMEQPLHAEMPAVHPFT